MIIRRSSVCLALLVGCITTRYLGGIFSLDGIHPARTGNALVANAFIEAINARFGEGIPPARASRRRSLRTASEVREWIVDGDV